MPWNVTVSSPKVRDADLQTYKFYLGVAFNGSENAGAGAPNPVQHVYAGLADGTYSLAVSSVDQAGNESAKSISLTVILDSVSPAVPGQPTLIAAVFVP